MKMNTLWVGVPKTKETESGQSEMVVQIKKGVYTSPLFKKLIEEFPNLLILWPCGHNQDGSLARIVFSPSVFLALTLVPAETAAELVNLRMESFQRVSCVLFMIRLSPLMIAHICSLVQMIKVFRLSPWPYEHTQGDSPESKTFRKEVMHHLCHLLGSVQCKCEMIFNTLKDVYEMVTQVIRLPLLSSPCSLMTSSVLVQKTLPFDFYYSGRDYTRKMMKYLEGETMLHQRSLKTRGGNQ